MSALASKPAFSQHAFKKLVSSHAESSQLRRGVEALRKRVEKHFGDADEPDVSRGLVTKVLGACEERWVEEMEKLARVPKAVYGDDSTVGASKEEVAKWFRGVR